MIARFHEWVGVSLLVGVLATVGFAADSKDDNEPKKYPFSVKLIDEDGKPVEGATAGVGAWLGHPDDPTNLVDEQGWGYWYGAKSNADGVVNFVNGGDRDHLCVVARNAGRKLVGIWKLDTEKIDPEKATENVVVVLHPECRVSGRLACSDLSKRNREIGFTNVRLSHLENIAYEVFPAENGNLSFHFFVPPGEYEFNNFGENLYMVEKQISVQVGQRELDLGTIDVPASRLALLKGQPAPKLEGIECWKNGPAVDLAELKGQCVILDFWGYWCGPCVHGMPDLFDLYAKYHAAGLEIVGIHVDQGEDEDDPVDTVQKLDGKLTKVRQELWKGRDVPYPVGLVTGKQTSFDAGVETRKARSGISAQFGVVFYPTLILIDRRGNIVRRFNPRLPEDITLLEKLLNDKKLLD